MNKLIEIVKVVVQKGEAALALLVALTALLVTGFALYVALQIKG